MTPISAEALARRRGRTRDAIVDAAWALCRDQGLAALSMRDLAAAVGLRAPSLYSYVASKDEVYDAMFAEGQRQFADALADVEVDAARPRVMLRRGARRFFAFCTEDPTRYQLLFQRVVPGFEPSPASYALALANLEGLAAQLAAAGVTDPRHADLFTAVLTGLVDQQLSNDPGGDRWGRLVDEAVDLLCDHAGIPAGPEGDR